MMSTPTNSAKAAEQRSIVVADGRSERFEGFDLLALPLSSGHVLAFRRRATSSIGPPFTSVWHRDAAGRWTFYVDVVPSRSCPRYFGPALHDVRVDTIDLVWKSGYELSLYVRAARLHLALRLVASTATRCVTAAAQLVPPVLWRADDALAALGRAAGRALGAGPLTLSGRAPAGHTFRLRPRAVWRVEAAAVVLDGRDLGDVVALTERVGLGDFVIPRAALFAVTSAAFSLA